MSDIEKKGLSENELKQRRFKWLCGPVSIILLGIMGVFNSKVTSGLLMAYILITLIYVCSLKVPAIPEKSKPKEDYKSNFKTSEAGPFHDSGAFAYDANWVPGSNNYDLKQTNAMAFLQQNNIFLPNNQPEESQSMAEKDFLQMIQAQIAK